jgi:hypothetical protein
MDIILPVDIITVCEFFCFAAMCVRLYDDCALCVTPVVWNRHSRFQEHKCGCRREIRELLIA